MSANTTEQSFEAGIAEAEAKVEEAISTAAQPVKATTITLPFGMGKVEVAKVEVPKVELPKVQFVKGQLPKVELPQVEFAPSEVVKFDVRRPSFKEVDVKSMADEARQKATELVKDVRGNVSHTVTLVREAVGI